MGADLKVLAREAGMLAVSRIVGSNTESSTAESMKYVTQLLNKDNSEELAVTESIVVQSGHAVKNGHAADAFKSKSEINVCGEDALEKDDSVPDLYITVTDGLLSDTSSSSSFMHMLDSVSVGGPGEGDIKEPESDNHPIPSCTVSGDIAVGMDDFLSAAKHVQPTAKREGFAVVPDVSWGKPTIGTA